MTQELPNQLSRKESPGLCQQAVYRICVQGYLDDHWANWFAGMTLTRDSHHNTTTLTGAVPDQPALHGILAQIRDLTLPLLSLARLDAESNRPPH